MRATALVVVAGLSFAIMSAGPTNATPMLPTPAAMAPANIVQVWGGCGWGFHPTYWGACVPNRRYYGYYRPGYRHYGYYRPYWRYHRWHRHW